MDPYPTGGDRPTGGEAIHGWVFEKWVGGFVCCGGGGCLLPLRSISEFFVRIPVLVTVRDSFLGNGRLSYGNSSTLT